MQIPKQPAYHIEIDQTKRRINFKGKPARTKSAFGVVEQYENKMREIKTKYLADGFGHS